MKSVKKSLRRVKGGGFEDNEKVVLVKAEEAVDIAALHSDHEEADTRLLLYAKHAASDYPRILFSLLTQMS